MEGLDIITVTVVPPKQTRVIQIKGCLEKLRDQAFIVATRKWKLLGGSLNQSELCRCVFGLQNIILSDISVEGLDKAVSKLVAVICNSGPRDFPWGGYETRSFAQQPPDVVRREKGVLLMFLVENVVDVIAVVSDLILLLCHLHEYPCNQPFDW